MAGIDYSNPWGIENPTLSQGQNPYADFLETNPQMTFMAFLNGYGKKSKNFNDYFSNQYSNLYNQYQGQVGQQALSGNEPTMNFTDFLKGYNFNNAWNSLSSANRGQRTAARINWNL